MNLMRLAEARHKRRRVQLTACTSTYGPRRDGTDGERTTPINTMNL